MLSQSAAREPPIRERIEVISRTERFKVAKIVERLKKKHRSSVWKDAEGDLWFFSAELERWVVLLADDHDGYEVSSSFEHDSFGPFTRAAHSTFLL